MRKTHLVLLVGVLALSFAIAASSLRLRRQNVALKSRLDAEISQEKALNAPLPGWAMPPLKGRKSDGAEAEIRLQNSAPKLTLLLFDPQNCKVCDQDWAFWNQLISDPDNGFAYLAVTAAPPVPRSYWADHHTPRHSVIFSADPEVLKQMRMQATPQTIFMERGTVKKVWFGLLSDEDVKEIDQLMQTEE
jgi:hypothetical protein